MTAKERAIVEQDIAQHVVQIKGPAMALPAAHPDESTAIIAMIERAARDPAVDVNKMERLFEMQARVRTDEARRAFDVAFAQLQEKLPEIGRNGKIIVRKKDKPEEIVHSTPYALWEDINKIIKPILAEHGFGLSFRMAQTEARITTTAVLSHSGGHREETSFSAPLDATGSKNNVQGWGSSFSYGKRYAATALLNITTRGEDDDGKAAGDPATISEEQETALRDKIEAVEADIPRFCRYFKIEKLPDLPAKRFDEAMKMLGAKK